MASITAEASGLPDECAGGGRRKEEEGGRREGGEENRGRRRTRMGHTHRERKRGRVRE
jgi:hypothetical protein